MLLKAHVDQVTFDGKRATGVRLKNGATIRARKNVVSNASMWDTLPLLPSHMVPASMQQQADTTPQNRSFMHLHLGFDATGGARKHCFHCCCPLRLRLGFMRLLRGASTAFSAVACSNCAWVLVPWARVASTACRAPGHHTRVIWRSYWLL